MAGSMCKKNQMQQQKRKAKGGKHYGIKKIRMHEIPLVCNHCDSKRINIVPSIVAYQKGGNNCRDCGEKLSFATDKFTHNITKR